MLCTLGSGTPDSTRQMLSGQKVLNSGELGVWHWIAPWWATTGSPCESLVEKGAVVREPKLKGSRGWPRARA